MPSSSQNSGTPFRTPGARRVRQAPGLALLLLTLGALAAIGVLPWNAVASTSSSVAATPQAAAPVPAGVGVPSASTGADGTAPRLADGPSSPGPNVDGSRGTRRTPKVLAGDLERKLLALRAARQRGDQAEVEALKQDLLHEHRVAPGEMQGQLGRGTSPVYWAATLLRDAVEQDDEAALDRALRYLHAMAGR